MSPSVTVGPQGRIVIPAAIRKRLGLEAGEALSVRVENDSIVLEPVDAIMRRMWAQVGATGKTHVVESLLHERQSEARREAAK